MPAPFQFELGYRLALPLVVHAQADDVVCQVVFSGYALELAAHIFRLFLN